MSAAAGEYLSAALGVAWRSLHHAFTTPALLFPALIFPLFFLAAFAGGLSAVSQTPNFDYPEGYTTFIFGFVLLQSSALGGVFTGFSVAADFQFGMGRRMLLATRHRTAIIAGYAITAIVRRSRHLDGGHLRRRRDRRHGGRRQRRRRRRSSTCSR